ncbi:MAG: glycosyltransferase family 4 protein [Lachnospiraceae bacterium]|nr:glycosyltransferase family 4 protein [Lachnospiraceae bacterium]
MPGTILHIMNYAASYRGNFIDSLWSLDKKLQLEGLKNIYLFAGDAKSEGPMSWIKEMQQQGEEVYFLAENRNQDAGLIRKLIEEKNVKAVHTHFITMQQYLAVYQATFGKKIPVFMHMHNHSKVAGNPIKNIIRRTLYRKCIMIACSESVYHSLERDYPKNEKYSIDNGVNFSRLDSYENLREEDFGLEKSEGVFLIFGFDFYRKGVDLAVKALKELRNQGHSFSLLVSLSTNFEQVEKNIIDILGEMPSWIKVISARNDVATLYNFVDVFLSPSREEGLPYSVVEAGYSSCSVVMSDISAQVHLKIPYGYWFESENVEDFADKILKAQKEHIKKLENWDKAKQSMRENYALDTWSEQVEKLYKKIL